VIFIAKVCLLLFSLIGKARCTLMFFLGISNGGSFHFYTFFVLILKFFYFIYTIVSFLFFNFLEFVLCVLSVNVR
jgi:hypothetical protein